VQDVSMTNNWVDKTRDKLYGISSGIEEFKSKHPDEDVIVASGTTGRKMNEEENFSLSLSWLSSRRAALILSKTALYCQDWVIPLDKLKYAEITILPTVFTAKVLIIKVADSSGNHYQFGVNDVEDWLAQDVISFKRQKVSLAYSIYNWSLRFLLIGTVILWLSIILNR
jgi:hypothetical protein